jgi:glycosyltransferase involved in cell wall biosynthesis
MRVLYDHQIFSYQRFGGISRYFAELMKCYSNMEEIDYLLGVKESPNESLRSTGLAKKHGITTTQTSDNLINLSCRYLKNNSYTGKLIKEKEFDIFHPTFFFPGLIKKMGEKPFIVTIMDMIPERFPKIYSKKGLYSKYVTHGWINGKKELAEKAQAIIAISEKTKNDLVDIYGINPNKIKVVYLGNSLFPQDSSSSKLKLPEKYLLFVGTRNDYKNFDRFLKASARIMKEDQELNIVCVGGGNFSKNEKTLISSLGVESRVNQYNVTDAELYYVYQNAQAFIFPSLYEGFGIPIIEAFVAQCPVILSNSSCFPEIAGDAAVYFDATDEDSIMNSIKQTIYNSELQASLKVKGLERSKQFSWENTARKTLDVYKSVLG